MHLVREISENLFWVGADDRRLELFENVFPIPRGVSYNSYLLLDKKTVLFDTVDKSVSAVFYENLSFLLKNRSLDYVVINHVEPDHCANLAELVLRYPGVKIVGNAKTADMLKQFNNFEASNYNFESGFLEVKEGDFLETGKHKFTFVMAPMVHWPEVMVSYDTTEKILFSADAFGTFGALSGHIFADELNFETEWLNDARRYYTNIVGKYGNQVQALLAKAAALDIKLVCPLHGPVWRKNFGWYLEKYQRWSAYVPEDDAVLIVYGSIYGNTENAANILAALLAEKGVRNIRLFNVSKTHPSEIVAEAFRCSHLIFAAATYNAGVFCNMETVLEHLKAHNIQNRTVAIIENGSWAPQAGEIMAKFFQTIPKINMIERKITINSSLKQNQRSELELLAGDIYASMPKTVIPAHDVKTAPIQNEPFFKLSYGLFLLTVRDGEKDNGCIINTAVQLTDVPKRITFSVIRKNYTNDILKTPVFLNI
jgi:flavorubredoxin